MSQTEWLIDSSVEKIIYRGIIIWICPICKITNVGKKEICLFCRKGRLFHPFSIEGEENDNQKRKKGIKKSKIY